MTQRHRKRTSRPAMRQIALWVKNKCSHWAPEEPCWHISKMFMFHDFKLMPSDKPRTTWREKPKCKSHEHPSRIQFNTALKNNATLNSSWAHAIALSVSRAAFSHYYLNWLVAANSHTRSTLILVHPGAIFSWDISAWQQCSKYLSCRMSNIWPLVTQINY